MEREMKVDREMAFGEGAWSFDGIEDDFDTYCTLHSYYLDSNI